MRIDPPPSEACATGAMPEATLAAAPPELPPGVWSMFHGLRVTPNRSDSVREIAPNSGVVVLPINTKPARRNLPTTSWSSSAGTSGVAREPWVVTQPATSSRSLIGIGTPVNGGRSVPSRRAAATTSSAVRASARALSSSRRLNALSAGLIRSTRSRYSSSTSDGLTSPARMATATCRAVAWVSMGGRYRRQPLAGRPA